jgi:hypothetical protein
LWRSPVLKKKSFSRPLRQLYSEYISGSAVLEGEGVAAVSCWCYEACL